MRKIFSACHGGSFPVEPGPLFPADILEPGALPTHPYDFAFWGFPCTPWSALRRGISLAEVDQALTTFEKATERLHTNPPQAHSAPPLPPPCPRL